MSRSTALALAALVVAAFALPACDDNPTRPLPVTKETPPPEPEGFVPLTLGSSWEYTLDVTIDMLDQDGRPVQPRRIYNLTEVRALVAVDTIAGREYVVEKQTTFASDSPDTVVQWRRFRQDSTGLYRAAVPLDSLPGTLPRMTDVVEFRRLLYPLETGDHWPLVAGDRSVIHFVDGPDTLTVGTGEEPSIRIRVVVAGAGPNDYVLRWFSRTGFLGRTDHHEYDARDLATGQQVHLISHEMERLVRADIAVLR